MRQKQPAFLMYVDNWLGGTRSLTFEMKGIYLELLCFQWSNGPFTDEELKSFLRPFSRQIRAKFLHILSTFFCQNCEKKWHNIRLEKERQKMAAKSEKASNSAKTRWSGNNTTREEGMRTHNANAYATGHAPAMLLNSKVKIKEDQEANSRVLDQPKKIDQPNPTPSSREGENQKPSGRVGERVFPESEDSLPEPLRTPEFEAAWKRWLDFRLACDGRLNPIQQQLQLRTCVERGAEKAARDLDASILGNSKGQIFDSERFSRRKAEAKPEDDRAFPTHFRIGTRNIPVADDGTVRCPFADKPTLLGRYAEDGQWHWLVDEDYMKSFADCEKNGIYVFWRDYPDLMRPDDVAKYQRRVQKQKLNRV